MPGYSKGTTKLLDSMMADAKLNPQRQRELRQVMQHGARAAPRKQAPSAPNRRAVEYDDPLRGIALNPNLVYGHAKRSQTDIVRENHGYQRPQFGGGARPTNRDAQKSRLQDEWKTQFKAPSTSTASAASQQQPARSEAAKLHEQISGEIEERQQFVQQMRSVGNTEHDETMRQQINERMAELAKVEKMMGEEELTKRSAQQR